MILVARNFMEFFVEESCGYCVPCRAGNVLLLQGIEKVLAGHGVPGDLEYLQDLGETTKAMSRCGLGQTSPNPVLFTLKNFRAAYEARLHTEVHGFLPEFDIRKAVKGAEEIAGRQSVVFPEGGAR
jgi:[NiFe] hydrogenase diaphorase moiety large subunit